MLQSILSDEVALYKGRRQINRIVLLYSVGLNGRQHSINPTGIAFALLFNRRGFKQNVVCKHRKFRFQFLVSLARHHSQQQPQHQAYCPYSLKNYLHCLLLLFLSKRLFIVPQQSIRMPRTMYSLNNYFANSIAFNTIGLFSFSI